MALHLVYFAYKAPCCGGPRSVRHTPLFSICGCLGVVTFSAAYLVFAKNAFRRGMKSFSEEVACTLTRKNHRLLEQG